MPSVTVALLLTAVLAAAGCGAQSRTETTPAKPADGAAALAGRTFVSTAVDGRRLVARSKVTLSFESERLTASAGCNTITGPYRFDAGRLRFDGAPAMTEIGCERALAEQDRWLAGLLEAGVDASLAGEELTLSTGSVELRLSERAAQTPPLTGTVWRLDTVVEPGGSASNVPAGVKTPTLEIADDGAVSLFAGCNGGGGSATVRDDGFIDFHEIATTLMGCGEAAGRIEAAVTGMLRGKVSYAFDGSRLVLSKDGRQLIFRGG